MKPQFCSEVRSAIAAGLAEQLQIPVSADRIRLPARGAAAGCAIAVSLNADAARWAEQLDAVRDRFPTVWGAPLLAAVHEKNGWLLFDLSDALYAAAADRLAEAADPIPADHGCYPLHRLRMLARYPSAGCPADAAVQTALLLCLAANEAPTDANRARAEEALLSMAYHLPPAARTALLVRCGAVARAAAGLLYGS